MKRNCYRRILDKIQDYMFRKLRMLGKCYFEFRSNLSNLQLYIRNMMLVNFHIYNHLNRLISQQLQLFLIPKQLQQQELNYFLQVIIIPFIADTDLPPLLVLKRRIIHFWYKLSFLPRRHKDTKVCQAKLKQYNGTKTRQIRTLQGQTI